MTPVSPLQGVDSFLTYLFPKATLRSRSPLAVGAPGRRRWDGSAGARPPRARTVGGEQEIGCILLREPSYLIDLLLYLQTLQVIELRLVALEGAVDIVLSPAMGLVFALQEGEQGGVRHRERENTFCWLFSSLQFVK